MAAPRALKSAQENTPAAGVSYYYRTDEPESAPHTDWVQAIATDSQGVAWYGPVGGFTPVESGLLSPEGATAGFSVHVPEPGLYVVRHSLVDLGMDLESAADDAVVVERSDFVKVTDTMP